MVISISGWADYYRSDGYAPGDQVSSKYRATLKATITITRINGENNVSFVDSSSVGSGLQLNNMLWYARCKVTSVTITSFEFL